MNDDARLAAAARLSTPTAHLTAPDPFAFAILRGLNRRGLHVYAGTVSASTKARRRAANRAARAARRAQRRAA